MKITCGIWLFNSNNELLLTHPTFHKETFWTIPKGLVDEGETYFEAAKRELFEETSIIWSEIENDIEILQELPESMYNTKRKKLRSYVVKCNSKLYDLNLTCESLVHGFKIKGKEVEPFPECDDFKWVDLNNLEGIDMHHSHINLLDRVKSIINF